MTPDKRHTINLTAHELRAVRDALLIQAVDLAGMAHDARKHGYFLRAAELAERGDLCRSIIGKLDHAMDT